MPNCESCGARIDASDCDCPYCGAAVKQSTTIHQSELERPEKVYTIATDAEGNSHIRFGDGQTGQHPPSESSGISSAYRKGAGSRGNVPSGSIQEKLDLIDRRLTRVSDLSKRKGSRDDGTNLLDSMSAMSDLLSVYQSGIADEAHLSTTDRDRISKKEERIRPKLKTLVAFCERVDSKTKKKMGLSDSEIHKIRTTATRTLQMTESRSRKCAGCGTMNRLGNSYCQNCGAPL